MTDPGSGRHLNGTEHPDTRWVAGGQVIAQLEGHSGPVFIAAFSPDGQCIVTASADGTALIFRIITFDYIARLLASK